MAATRSSFPEFITGTEAELTAENPVLRRGQFAVAIDSDVLAVGDGVSTWLALPKYEAGTAINDLPELVNGVTTTVDDSTPGLVRVETNSWDEARTRVVALDDFHAPNTVADGIGRYGWDSDVTDTGAIAPNNDPRGVLSLATGTGATGAASVDLPILSAQVAISATGSRLGFRAAGQGGSAAQAAVIEFGWIATDSETDKASVRLTMNQANGSSVADSLTNDGSTTETQSLGANAAQFAYTFFEIRAVSNTSWSFYRNGTLVTTHTTNVPGLAQILKPFARITKSAGSGTSRIGLVDLMVLELAR